MPVHDAMALHNHSDSSSAHNEHSWNDLLPRSRPLRWLIFFGLLVFSAFVLMTLPWPLGMLVLAALLSAGIVVNRVNVRRLVGQGYAAVNALAQSSQQQAAPQHMEPANRLPRWQAALEIGVLLVVALLVTWEYAVPDSRTKLPGVEAEWIVGAGHIAHNALRDHGYLPLWNHHFRQGEPLIDNAVSFIYNPFSALPPMLFGAPQGVKYGIVVNAMLVTVGGWFLGRTLGLGLMGRILLGLLLLGKGNMHMMIKAGYYQLGVQQAYFPWITAGALMIMRSRKRWPVAMTGMMTALIFMAGNVWYILPMLINLAVITLTHLFALRPGEFINRIGLRRMIAAGAITLTFGAGYILPVLVHRDHIGVHGQEFEAGWVIEESWRAPLLYFMEDPRFAWFDLTIYLPRHGVQRFGELHFYHSYVTPLWYALLIFVLIPPLHRLLHRPALNRSDRIWMAGIIMVVLMTLWGMGGSLLFRILYDQFELLRGWRFVGRALAAGSFWVAVLVAMRTDGLWRALAHVTGERLAIWRGGALTILGAAGIIAAHSVLMQWYVLPRTERVFEPLDECLATLREHHPNEEFTIDLHGYAYIAAFIDHDMRMAVVESEFRPDPNPNTLGDPRMAYWLDQPEYAIPATSEMADSLRFRGYTPWFGSPVFGGEACIYHDPTRTFPYIATIMLETLESLHHTTDPRPYLRPALAYERLPDTMAALVEAGPEEQVVILRETAYPGWEVHIDGQRVPTEVTGGYVSALISPGDGLRRVDFAYRPPLLIYGSLATIASAIVVAGYLLNVDRLLLRRLSRRKEHPTAFAMSPASSADAVPVTNAVDVAHVESENVTTPAQRGGTGLIAIMAAALFVVALLLRLMFGPRKRE